MRLQRPSMRRVSSARLHLLSLLTLLLATVFAIATSTILAVNDVDADAEADNNAQHLLFRQATSPSASPPPGTLVLSLATGTATDQPGALTGETGFFNRFFSIAGTTRDLLYSRHRYGKLFTYTLAVPPSNSYSVTVLFAESYSPGCKTGFRNFDIAVFDADGEASAGVEETGVDIFARAGCRTAYRLTLSAVDVGSSGRIAVRFTAQKENAMMSALQIRTLDASFMPSPTASPVADASSTPAPMGLVQKLSIDVGGPTDIPSAVSGTSQTFSRSLQIAGTTDDDKFSMHRFGKDFTYMLDVTAAGTYFVRLMFAESYERGCFNGFRRFNVFAFDRDQGQASGKSVENIDVFRAAGCKRAYMVSIPDIQIGTGAKIALRFVAGRNNAMVSGIQVFSGTAAGSALPTPSMVNTESVSPSPPVVIGSPSPSSSETAESSSPSPSASASKSSSAEPSQALGATPSVSASESPAVSESATPSLSIAASPSSTPAVSPSESNGASASPTLSESATPSLSIAASPSSTPAVSPSESIGASASPSMSIAASPSLSASPSAGVSSSPSISADASASASVSVVPMVTPLQSVKPTTDSEEVNVGSSNDANVANTTRISTTKAVKGTGNVPASTYQTARVGQMFKYSFNLQPGAYDIILGFAELNDVDNCITPGKRAFNVYANDILQIEGFDIFEKAGCLAGVEKSFTQSVSAVLTQPLVLRFESVVGEAQINFINIKPAADTCVPESTTGQIDADHAAHSVPGSYPPQLNANSPTSFVDSDGDGFVTVQINGGGSHTHFFDPANNIVGRLTKYTWTLVETGEIVSNEVEFSYRFPLGTTRLRLSVIDNSCTTDEAETTITVVGAVRPGQYCYYYSGLTEQLVGGRLLQEPRPQFAAISSSVDLNFPTFSFSNTEFAARCVFFFERSQRPESQAVQANTTIDRPQTMIQVNTFNTGIARVYRGEDLIFDSEASNEASAEIPVGLTRFEVTYLRTSTNTPPRLQFRVDGQVPAPGKISHDRAAVVPIITDISPKEGTIRGGTQVEVTGYGLFQPLNVTIGGNSVSVLPNGATPTQFSFQTPAVPAVTVAQVLATTTSGFASNPVNFAYGSSCDPIRFQNEQFTLPGGGEVNDLQFPTSVVIGHDQRLYLGTLGGSVQVVTYDRTTLQTTARCYSKDLTDSRFMTKGSPSTRDILGIAIDPRDKVIRPYITTSTLFHSARSRIDNSPNEAWRNAAVERLKPGTDSSDPNVCLVFDTRLVSGLPVSNHDHGVNALLFTQDGDLLIGVGGSTNMGLPGYRLGNFWESPLSGAVLIARLSKPGFDGTVTYSNGAQPFLAQKSGGDVDVFSPGLRNCFALAMDRIGNVYAADQSNNCGFGNAGVTCSDFNLTAAQELNPKERVDWPGQVSFNGCSTSGVNRPDKILFVEEGKFYGHSNIQRGGGECAWIDPFTNLAADGSDPPANYQKPVVTIRSPATGLGQYRGNHFCGRLRGQLLASAYQARGVWRIGVNGGDRTSGPDLLTSGGGITYAENAHGELLFPRLSVQKLTMLRPVISAQAGVYIAGISPFRHGRAGGNPITIGGLNFGAGPNVEIGGNACTVTRSSETEIVCTVPAHSAGSKSLTVTTATNDSVTVNEAVLYMNV